MFLFNFISGFMANWDDRHSPKKTLKHCGKFTFDENTVLNTKNINHINRKHKNSLLL